MIKMALLTEVLTLLGRVARDPASAADCGPMADKLGLAMATAQARNAANGGSSTGGGRPGKWLHVADGEWTVVVQGAPAAARAINDRYGYEFVKETSLAVMLTRGAGKWSRRVEWQGRELALGVRPAKATEIPNGD